VQLDDVPAAVDTWKQQRRADSVWASYVGLAGGLGYWQLGDVLSPMGQDHINTDEIIPARYLNTDNEAELAKHCMEDLDKDFVAKVKPGDVIVAGDDFGCGSSREHAVWAIRGAKVQTVIAKSFARIFYRNAINCGFYLIESADAVDKITNGDEVEIDYDAGVIKDKTSKARIKFMPLPDFALEIIRDGGLLDHIMKTSA
jgi:3-isopropylmalate/(R)-2-methylmalate dehydratase small subunit